MTDQLKPCPFCGAHPVIDPDGYHGLQVACMNKLVCDPSPHTTSYATAKDAVEAWNRRSLVEPAPGIARDTERLNWFAANNPRVGLDEDGFTHLYSRVPEPAMSDKLGMGTTIREAIDVAMGSAPSPAIAPAPPSDDKWISDFEQAMANLHPEAVEAAAHVFMSYLPDNNRANTDADRLAARNIVATYFRHIGYVTRRDAPIPAIAPESPTP